MHPQEQIAFMLWLTTQFKHVGTYRERQAAEPSNTNPREARFKGEKDVNKSI